MQGKACRVEMTKWLELAADPMQEEQTRSTSFNPTSLRYVKPQLWINYSSTITFFLIYFFNLKVSFKLV